MSRYATFYKRHLDTIDTNNGYFWIILPDGNRISVVNYYDAKEVVKPNNSDYNGWEIYDSEVKRFDCLLDIMKFLIHKYKLDGIIKGEGAEF